MHKLRHTAVTEFLRANGGDLALAQQFARHASVSTTVDVYGHWKPKILCVEWFAQVNARSSDLSVPSEKDARCGNF